MWALGLLTWGSLVARTDSQMAAQVGPITSFQHAGANSAEQHYDMNIATFFFGKNSWRTIFAVEKISAENIVARKH